MILHNGRLTLDLGVGYVLIPLSENLFYTAGLEDLKVKFTSGAIGNTVMSWWIDGEWVDYTRLQEPDVNASRLSDYNGRYYCDETETYYSLFVRDGELWVKLGRQGEFVLKAFSPDVFALDVASLMKEPVAFKVDFYRKDGRVAGLYVSSGRIKNMQYEKL